MKEILKELESMWGKSNIDQISAFEDFIVKNKNNTFVGLGAGRMGYSLKSFVMRLSHLGLNAYMIGDTTLPRVDENSTVIVNSSSGETESLKIFTYQAKEAGASILLLTGNESSSLAKLADLKLIFPEINSNQIMKSIFEQYSFLLFDYIIKNLIAKLKLNLKFIEKNHSILE